MWSMPRNRPWVMNQATRHWLNSHMQSHAVIHWRSMGLGKQLHLRIQASPRPLTSTFYFVFLNFWLCFFILWEFHKGNFCFLFVVVAFFPILYLFVCLFFGIKSHYVMRLALNSQSRNLPLLAEFIGICHHFQTVCLFLRFYKCSYVNYACVYVYLHVWACGCICVGTHIHEVDIWYLSHSFSTLHTEQGCSLDLNSLSKLV